MVSMCDPSSFETHMFPEYLYNINSNERNSVGYTQVVDDLHGMTLSSDISESDLSEHGFILNLDSGQHVGSHIGFHSTHSEETRFNDDESDIEDLEFLDTGTQPWETEANNHLSRQVLPCFDELTRPLRTENVMSREQEISNNLHLLEEDENVMCRKGKRGAKHVLLWKFLLEKLRDSPELVRWMDRESGVFRFVDTIEISRQWGTKKGKRDMTFEKLSRAIRHYYKSGFMSRESGTRLVYRINWKMVPKAYR